MFKEIRELLEEARYHIDGGVNCHSHEYHALDKLERAVGLIASRMEAEEFAKQHAATTENP